MTLPPPSFAAPPNQWTPNPTTMPKLKNPSPFRSRGEWSPHDARRALIGLVVVGVAADLSLRSHPVGLAGVIAILLAIAAWLTCGRVTPSGRACLLLAVAIAPWLMFRMSVWLIAVDVIAIGSLVAAATAGRKPIRGWLSGAASAPATSATLVRSASPEHPRTHGRSYGRALLVALPLSAAVLLLLASGDRFFASWLGLTALQARIVDAFAITLLGLSWFCFVLTSRTDSAGGQKPLRAQRLNPVDAGVTLVGLAVVLSGYTSSLVAAAIGGRAYVERKAGLTYADYARSGFFQLVAVVVVVVGTLLYFGPALGGTRRRLQGLTVWVGAATIAMAVVAVIRLQTYRNIFGLTMLRFGTTLFAAWLAVVVVVVTSSLVGARSRRYLVTGIVVSAFVTLTIGNWTNPEAMIARENIARVDWSSGSKRSRSGAEFDRAYLEGLSDDAVPALVARLGILPVDQSQALRKEICNHAPTTDDSWSWNRSRERAHDALQTLCGWTTI